MDTLQTLTPAIHPAVVHATSEAPSDAGHEAWMTDALRRAVERVNAWHWQHEQTRLQAMQQELPPADLN